MGREVRGTEGRGAGSRPVAEPKKHAGGWVPRAEANRRRAQDARRQREQRDADPWERWQREAQES